MPRHAFPGLRATSLTTIAKHLLIVGLAAVHSTKGVVAAAAAVTSGPEAPVSMGKSDVFSSARKCAQGCIIYSGWAACGVNAGFKDLGVALDCGCSPTNDCYCSKDLASSATEYISSCVSAHCTGVVDTWPAEVTRMLGIYDGYCATANAAAATTSTPAITSSSGTAATTQSGPGKGTTALQTSPAGSSANPTQAAGGAESDKKGLSQSDIIALAASLGVGVPSLLIAAATLWVQLRKKKKKTTAGQADKDSSTETNIPLNDNVLLQSQQQPPPYVGEMAAEPDEDYYRDNAYRRGF